MSDTDTLPSSDQRSVAILESKARKLDGAIGMLESGPCRGRCAAALMEAAAILRDAASNCRRSPNVPSIREQ